MLEQTICELSILDFIFWAFILGMVVQAGREVVDYIFHRNDTYENEEDR